MDLTATAEPTALVREATGEDLPGVSSVFARSYSNCPAWRYYLPPQSRRRGRRMEAFFRSLLQVVYLRDRDRECLMLDDSAGVALWDPPYRWEMSASETLRMLAAMLPMFGRRLPLAVRWFNALDSGHPREPHYYLSALGVDPGAGAGVAEALMRPVLERCDANRVPAYLETGRPRSRGLFERHGFEVTEELTLPAGGPLAWRMWREPQD